jgi:hypothetical protein
MRATRVFIDRVRVTHARQYTYFFNTKSHTASPDFQTDARSSKAIFPSPGIRSAFQDILYPYDLIHRSLITLKYQCFMQELTKSKFLNEFAYGKKRKEMKVGQKNAGRSSNVCRRVI